MVHRGCALLLAILAVDATVPPLGTGSNVVVDGAARFTALTDRTLRIEYSAAVGSAGFDNLPSTTVVERSPAGAPAFKRSTDSSQRVLTLRTDWLTLHYRRGEALLPASRASCDVMNVTVHSTGAVWCLAMGVAAPSQQNLNGSLETTDCYVGWRHCLAVYDGKMQPGVVSRSGYAVINDTSAVLFDTTNENFSWPSGWRKPRSHPPGSYVDLLFFGHGHQYKDAMRDYTTIGGAIPLMPWKSYGVWWSRYHRYSAQSLVTEVLDGFTEHRLPLHSVVLDTDWHTGRGYDPATNCSRKTDQGYNWNRTLFPDPIVFEEMIHSRGLMLSLNVHDQGLIDKCQRNYSAVMKAVGKSETAIASGSLLYCHFEDEAWSEAMHHYMLEAGDNAAVDGWWTDFGGAPGGVPVPGFNGNAEWQCSHDSHPIGISGPLNASYEPGHGDIDLGFQYGNGRTPGSLWAQYVRHSRWPMRTSGERRGFRMGINGGYGAHRYPLVGSGDTEASWATASYQMYMNIAGANVATMWTHDLGGFYGQVPYSQCPPGDPGWTRKCNPALGGDPFLSGCNVNSCMPGGCHAYPGNVTAPGLCMHDPELHLRWLQQGVLSHVFRTHCEACEIRPWMFPQGWPELMYQSYHLRAALLPYIYTAAWQSTHSGVLTMHPLYYEWPEEDAAYTHSTFSFEDDTHRNPLNIASTPLQYLFGRDFMAAPIQTPATIGVPSLTPQSDLQVTQTMPVQAHAVSSERFTLFKGSWCGQGTCMHSTPIGGIQPAPNYLVCEARCQAAAPTKCLSFDFQNGKCYQWPCFALAPAPNQDNTTVCGNRSNTPGPPPGPLPPPSPPRPEPPPTPPAPLPPPKKAVGYAIQDIWIPPGVWVHWQSGKQFRGPRLFSNQSFELAEIPLYARLGSVIPLKNANESARLAPETLILAVMAGEDAKVDSNGTCQVYEDDGASTRYTRRSGSSSSTIASSENSSSSEYSLLEVVHNTVGAKATVHVVPGHGSGRNGKQPYTNAPTDRIYQIEYRNSGSAPAHVRVDGVAVPHRSRLTSIYTNSTNAHTAAPSWWMRAPCTEVTCTYDAPAVVVRTGWLDANAELTIELSF